MTNPLPLGLLLEAYTQGVMAERKRIADLLKFEDANVRGSSEVGILPVLIEIVERG